MEFLCQQSCKAPSQLLEALLSLILGVEEKFESLCNYVLPILGESTTHSDWAVRKIAVDVLYTLSVLIPEPILIHKEWLLEILNKTRFDKVILFIVKNFFFFLILLNFNLKKNNVFHFF